MGGRTWTAWSGKIRAAVQGVGHAIAICRWRALQSTPHCEVSSALARRGDPIAPTRSPMWVQHGEYAAGGVTSVVDIERQNLQHRTPIKSHA